MTPKDLWQRLVAADLVSGRMPPAGTPGAAWYVSAMVAVAAWIASIFLLVALGAALAGVLRSAAGSLVTGALICAACAAVMRVGRDGLFVKQFAVAASLAGQALLAYGILQAHWRSPEAWLTFALVECGLVAASPVYVHRVLCTIAAVYAVRFAFAHAGVGAMFAPLVAGAFVAAWSCVRARPLQGPLWRPVMAGVALVGLLLVPASLVDTFAWQVRTAPVAGAWLAWVAAVILAGVLVLAIRGILLDTGVGVRSRTAWIAFAAGAGIALAAQPVPGLVVALVVLLVAFHEGSRTLMGLALAGMIGALVHHYYALDATLLAKSGALLATGIVVLVAGAAVRYGLAEAETRHA